jgi:hypothetical protein
MRAPSESGAEDFECHVCKVATRGNDAATPTGYRSYSVCVYRTLAVLVLAAHLVRKRYDLRRREFKANFCAFAIDLSECNGVSYSYCYWFHPRPAL